MESTRGSEWREMSLSVATHSGPFHADDVLAWAMVRCFVDESATLVRTREPELIERSDMVMDVGGIYDPSSLRFDHHQQSYQGPLSSAGMVLEWLRDTQRISHLLFAELRLQLVRWGRRRSGPSLQSLRQHRAGPGYGEDRNLLS